LTREWRKNNHQQYTSHLIHRLRIGEIMEIIGFCLGTLGFILGAVALAKLTKLEKHLKETGILDKDFQSD
jgi:hypothetical protein